MLSPRWMLSPRRGVPSRAAEPVVALVVLSTLAACTGSPTLSASPAPLPSSPTPSVASPPPMPTVTFGDGQPLPEGCVEGRPRPSQTVAFVAQGRAWAVDPRGVRLTCLFEVDEPAPFAWGPQGDRVLLGGLEIRGIDPASPTFPPIGPEPGTYDWGHPLGLSVVYVSPGHRVPEKRFMDDGHVERLTSMPAGRYLDVAYHPSGLAIAFVLEEQGEQSIWLSTNTGADPQRLVFSEGGTRFPSVGFSPDGSQLVWVAQHLRTYQVHRMDLTDRSSFDDGWRGELDEQGSNLQLAPEGQLLALDVGPSCDDRTAMAVLSPTVARPALPDDDRPTTAIGWLDRTTLLVGVGGCDGPMELRAVDVLDGLVTDLVHGAELASTRTVVLDAPDSVPAPPEEAPPPPPEGVG